MGSIPIARSNRARELVLLEERWHAARRTPSLRSPGPWLRKLERALGELL